MIALTITYRNRDLRIVETCFKSLNSQTNTDFELFFIDYGSSKDYSKRVKLLCENYDFINYIHCPVEGQLWNKSRAINIALKKTNCSKFIVGDVDMIYNPNFIELCHSFHLEQQFVYFQVGVLTQLESLKILDFNEYTFKFKTNKEATGITLFKTESLKSVNGYDEFYHGWGGEDTDIHERLKLKGLSAHFYEEELMCLHQWHPKAYRTAQSKAPYHSLLERINHEHLKLTKQLKITKVNTNCDWGILPLKNDYNILNNSPCKSITLSNSKLQVDAFFQGILPKLNGVIYVEFTIKQEGFKNKIKSYLGKKYIPYYNKQDLSNKVLEAIILNYRNQPYHFQSLSNRIELTIKL